MVFIDSICSWMWSVALHHMLGSSMLSCCKSSLNESVYFLANDHAVSPVRIAPASILSWPVSPSEVRCPTSVILITWFTEYP